jgi:hypothetical protein
VPCGSVMLRTSYHALELAAFRRLSSALKLIVGENLVCGFRSLAPLTTEQIAERLHIAPTTVETHRQSFAKKVKSKSVAGQVQAAIRGGLIDP